MITEEKTAGTLGPLSFLLTMNINRLHVSQIKTGIGFEAGLVIVVIAILLDCMTQNIGKKKGGTA
ncbi:hypothetical protein F4V44_02180 [Niallia endozanthoxylica]|uniref:Uncharacterized protein n=1 Tax=Niallia endozanthoxylica TaxID=2036016 RepID=A0A5J5I530_9BACI|nr:hypothetical protein [Niallia endozanthoxylica]KAA9030625.1 hypothetical protein F4V44_02180 [Niallia endozanthoxylica]